MIQRCRECGIMAGGLVTVEERNLTGVKYGWPEADLCPNCAGKLQHPETMCGFPVVVDHNFKAINQEIVFGDFEDLVPQFNFKLDELPLEVLFKFKEQIDARIKELSHEQA